MTEKELRKHIEMQLSGNIVNVELTKDDYNYIIKHSLDMARPFYSGIRYIQVQGPGPIDVSNHKISSIVGIEKTRPHTMNKVQQYMFGAPGIIVYDQDFRNTFTTYLTQQMRANHFENVHNLTWRFVNNQVYISQKGEFILKCLVSIQNVTDIEEDSRWLSWIKDHAVAQARIIVGQARSKFALANSQYDTDGERMVERGAADKKELEDARIGPISII